MKKLLFTACILIYLVTPGQTYTAGTMYSTYFDIVPDTLLNYAIYPYTHETYGTDLFDSAQNDFLITADGATSPGGTSASITLISQNPNLFFRFGRLDSVFVPAYSYWDVTKVALPLSAGEQINAPGAVWDTTLLYLTDHSGWGGGNKDVNDWIGGDKYIGMKYENQNITAYGWIRVQCKAKDSCFVKDYSFNTGSFGITEFNDRLLSVFPNPFQKVFCLNENVGEIKINDPFGREVRFTKTVIGHTTQIDLTDNPAGIYFLEQITNDRPFTRKLVKTDN